MKKSRRYPIAKNLAKARAESGMTMDELAIKAKVGKTTICDIEHGTRNPTVGTALAIAKALGIPLIELTGA